MKHLGIFIEPIEELRNYILNLKKSVRIYNENFPYLRHPPHITLLHGNFLKQSLVEETLGKILTNTEPFEITSINLNSFKNDNFTGLNTLFVEIKQNNKLINLQNYILENIKPDQPVVPKIASINRVMKKNLERYNYPFAYPDWIPHFTIASVDENIENKILNLNNEIPHLSNKITKVSLWEISGEKHFKISEFKLGL